MGEMVYLNGEIVPAGEARISVFDAGFSHAAGLFETMRVYGGHVWRFREHLHRLENSSKILGMKLSVNLEALERGTRDVVAANGLRDARVRLTMTPGRVPRRDEPATAGQATTLIVAEPVQPYPAEMYRRGMRVCISPYKQDRNNPLVGHKTLAYFPRLMAMKRAAELGCTEALWFNTDNELAEGSVCNVFIVKDGSVLTPPLDTPILPGTVRDVVIDLARRHEVPIDERAIDIETLLGAEEVFLTGSVLEVMPATSIEKHVVGSGEPGPVTLRLKEFYARLIADECSAE